MTDSVLLGFQGWDHPEWGGRSNSQSGRSHDMLEQYSRQYPTVEVDDTFYGIPPEPVVRQWRDSVSPGFLFSLKAPQQVTHEQRFAGRSGLLKRFLERVSMLEGNLGPIVLLAPPGFEPDDASRAALRSFIRELPGEFNWALELRHVDWFTEELHDLLSSNNIALVAAENRWIRRATMFDLAERPTADFAYVRWNSPLVLSPTGEETAAKQRAAAAWASALERMGGLVGAVYGYFSVSVFGFGTQTIEEIRSRLGQQWLKGSFFGEAAASAD